MSLNKRYTSKDVHFQDLTQFEIKDFIKEEIYLNIPNINSTSINTTTQIINNKKITRIEKTEHTPNGVITTVEENIEYI